MIKSDNDLVKLKFADGRYSDEIPRVRAAFIRAFTFTGKRPEIIELNDAIDPIHDPVNR